MEKLEVTDAILKETLRHSPIGQRLFSRVLDKDLKLEDGRIIPKNIPVHVNIWEMHRNDKLWPKANLYDPGRFYENRYNTDPYAYFKGFYDRKL